MNSAAPITASRRIRFLANASTIGTHQTQWCDHEIGDTKSTASALTPNANVGSARRIPVIASTTTKTAKSGHS
jgi:hypothetical protein